MEKYCVGRSQIQKIIIVHNHEHIVGFRIHIGQVMKKNIVLSISKTYPDGCSVPIYNDLNVWTGDTIDIGQTPSL